MRLNLGCGEKVREGWTNVDYLNFEGVDIVHNLDSFPYPFEDNSIDEIFMEHVFEHLEYPIRCLEELWRICKDNAKIVISVPHWSHFTSYCDLTHKTICSSSLFLYYEVGKPWYYSNFANFKVVEKKFTATRENVKFINPILNPILNLSHLFTELFLCKFLPVSQIIFELRVVKGWY